MSHGHMRASPIEVSNFQAGRKLSLTVANREIAVSVSPCVANELQIGRENKEDGSGIARKYRRTPLLASLYLRRSRLVII
jgi:hypothetical protein